MPRILIVEDDPDIAELLAHYLQRAGHTVDRLSSGEAVLPRVRSAPPDLMILDLMLPGLDGLEVCRRLRATHPNLPVLMLTARNEAEDRIAGLEVGADDYVAKPFSPRELVLRVDSVLRRSERPSPQRAVHRVGGLTVDTAARRAVRDGRELALTVREMDLLMFLLAHPDRAFRRDELMREVWGWTFGDQSTVTVHVRRLREKIEHDPNHPQLIQTVWGVGYRLQSAAVPVTR
jgi:DNA-binding response OmpR family regulator